MSEGHRRSKLKSTYSLLVAASRHSGLLPIQGSMGEFDTSSHSGPVLVVARWTGTGDLERRPTTAWVIPRSHTRSRPPLLLSAPSI